MAERTSLKQIRDAGKRKKAGTDIGVIGALADPQFREDVLRGLGETSARGVAGVLGAPVDLTTMALRPFGYSVPAEQVVGGSDYLGRQMERAGLISGERRPIAEILGGIMTPDPLDVAKLGAMAVPVVARRMAPRDEAMRIAQANAAKPTSEGGLGLRPDNTPMERAQAMGFDVQTSRFHGSDQDILAFDPQKFGKNDQGWYGRGVFSDTDPEVAAGYANYNEAENGQVIYPLITRGKFMSWPEGQPPFSSKADSIRGTKDIESLGYSGVNISNDRDLYGKTPDWQTEQVVFNPANVRSRFAAFDPAKRYESDLLGAANPVLLGTIAAGTGAGLYGYNQRQKEKEKRPTK